MLNSLEEKIFTKRKNLYQSSIETYASELIKNPNNLIRNKISFKFKKIWTLKAVPTILGH